MSAPCTAQLACAFAEGFTGGASAEGVGGETPREAQRLRQIDPTDDVVEDSVHTVGLQALRSQGLPPRRWRRWDNARRPVRLLLQRSRRWARAPSARYLWSGAGGGAAGGEWLGVACEAQLALASELPARSWRMAKMSGSSSRRRLALRMVWPGGRDSVGPPWQPQRRPLLP